MVNMLVSLVLAAQSTMSAGSVRLAPAVITEINLGEMKGKLVRQLAWSPDLTQLYLMTYDANRDASVKEAFHYLIPAGGGAPARVDAQPDWATAYHEWKSGKASPDDPKLTLEPGHERRKDSAVAIPMGGDAARGGGVDATGGLATESAIEAARATQNTDVYTIRFKGEIIGEWINHPIVPGVTFGWGPKGSGLLAFSERKSGRLIIMDHKGAKQKIDDTKNVVAPSWSGDATKIAYLEGRGRDKFAVVVATVTR